MPWSIEFYVIQFVQNINYTSTSKNDDIYNNRIRRKMDKIITMGRKIDKC